MRKWGHMFKKVLWLVGSQAIVGLLFQISSAQHYAKIDDRLGIELALDMIRKGVQEQDTGKVFMTFAPNVYIKGKEEATRAQLASKLQTAFANSQNRQIQLERPFYPPNYDKLRSSNFWDFDFLEPKITIKGDSAFVDCELVLWGAPPEPKSQQHGRRVSERFVFYSPPKVSLSALPEDSHPFPESSGKKIPDPRGWQIVGFENFVEFLENQVNTNTNSTVVPKGHGE